jgi:hypothetical protein
LTRERASAFGIACKEEPDRGAIGVVPEARTAISTDGLAEIIQEFREHASAFY